MGSALRWAPLRRSPGGVQGCGPGGVGAPGLAGPSLLLNASLSEGPGERSRVSARASWGEVLFLAAVRVLMSGVSRLMRDEWGSCPGGSASAGGHRCDRVSRGLGRL